MICTSSRSEHYAASCSVTGSQQVQLVHRDIVYCFALFVICTSSGGVILGFGSFSLKFKEAQLLSADDLNVVFNVGFQLLTFFTLMWSCLHDSIGPRAVGTAGMALAAAGNLLIALAAHAEIRNVYLYAAAYGLVGGGGNGAFIAAFHFASLFNAQGVRCATLSAGFNVAGYFYLLLNIRSLSLEVFFYGATAFTVLLGVGICRIYPDTPYARGDVAVLSPWPRCRGRRAGERGSLTRCGTEVWEALRRAAPALQTIRYWGFCFTFGWGALVMQWAGGAVGSSLLFPDAEDYYLEWADPLITNATFLISPIVGAIIDRSGFRFPGLLVLSSAIALVGVLWTGGSIMQWPALVLMLILGAAVYTIQFAYLTMAFPNEMYSGLLTVSICVQEPYEHFPCMPEHTQYFVPLTFARDQELLGFIAWPTLAVIKPFGADPSVGNFLLMLVPSTLLLAWPLWLQAEDDKRLIEQGIVGANRAATKSGGAVGSGSQTVGGADTAAGPGEFDIAPSAQGSTLSSLEYVCQAETASFGEEATLPICEIRRAARLHEPKSTAGQTAWREEVSPSSPLA